jgi:hypothetical protein
MGTPYPLEKKNQILGRILSKEITVEQAHRVDRFCAPFTKVRKGGVHEFENTDHAVKKSQEKTAGNVSGREKRKTRAVNPCCRTSG